MCLWTEGLEVYSKSASLRSGYCHFACLCGQWKVANDQFKLLGDKADPLIFGDKETMEKLRKQAAELGSEK